MNKKGNSNIVKKSPFKGGLWRTSGANGRGGDAKSVTNEDSKMLKQVRDVLEETLQTINKDENSNIVKKSPFKGGLWRTSGANGRGGDPKSVNDESKMLRVQDILEETLQTMKKEDSSNIIKKSPFKGGLWRTGGATGRGGDAKTGNSLMILF